MKRYTKHAPGHLGVPGGLVKQGMGALRWPRRAQAPLLHNNKEPHWDKLRPCNPRGHRGPPVWNKWTQMLPANAQRARWGSVWWGERNRRCTYFFLPLVEAVISQIPALSHNHWSQRPPCKKHCGEIIRGAFVFEGEREQQQSFKSFPVPLPFELPPGRREKEGGKKKDGLIC